MIITKGSNIIATGTAILLLTAGCVGNGGSPLKQCIFYFPFEHKRYFLASKASLHFFGRIFAVHYIFLHPCTCGLDTNTKNSAPNWCAVFCSPTWNRTTI